MGCRSEEISAATGTNNGGGNHDVSYTQCCRNSRGGHSLKPALIGKLPGADAKAMLAPLRRLLAYRTRLTRTITPSESEPPASAELLLQAALLSLAPTPAR